MKRCYNQKHPKPNPLGEESNYLLNNKGIMAQNQGHFQGDKYLLEYNIILILILSPVMV